MKTKEKAKLFVETLSKKLIRAGFEYIPAEFQPELQKWPDFGQNWSQFQYNPINGSTSARKITKEKFEAMLHGLPQNKLKRELLDKVDTYFVDLLGLLQKTANDSHSVKIAACVKSSKNTMAFGIRQTMPYNLYLRKKKIDKKALEELNETHSLSVCILFLSQTLADIETTEELRKHLRHCQPPKSVASATESWLRDAKILCNACAGQSEPVCLQRVMSFFCDNLADEDVSRTDLTALSALKESVVTFLTYCNAKPASAKEFTNPCYDDFLAAILSVYVDIVVTISCSQEGDKTAVGQQLCSTVLHFLHSRSFLVLDVLLQTNDFLPAHADVVSYLCRKMLQIPFDMDEPPIYTKYVAAVRRVGRQIPALNEDCMKVFAASQSESNLTDHVVQVIKGLFQHVLAGVRPPKNYVSWLCDSDPCIASSFPHTKVLKRSRLTQYLFSDASDQLIEKLLDIVTVSKRQPSDVEAMDVDGTSVHDNAHDNVAQECVATESYCFIDRSGTNEDDVNGSNIYQGEQSARLEIRRNDHTESSSQADEAKHDEPIDQYGIAATLRQMKMISKREQVAKKRSRNDSSSDSPKKIEKRKREEERSSAYAMESGIEFENTEEKKVRIDKDIQESNISCSELRGKGEHQSVETDGRSVQTREDTSRKLNRRKLSKRESDVSEVCYGKTAVQNSENLFKKNLQVEFPEKTRSPANVSPINKEVSSPNGLILAKQDVSLVGLGEICRKGTFDPDSKSLDDESKVCIDTCSDIIDSSGNEAGSNIVHQFPLFKSPVTKSPQKSSTETPQNFNFFGRVLCDDEDTCDNLNSDSAAVQQEHHLSLVMETDAECDDNVELQGTPAISNRMATVSNKSPKPSGSTVNPSKLEHTSRSEQFSSRACANSPRTIPDSPAKMPTEVHGEKELRSTSSPIYQQQKFGCSPEKAISAVSKSSPSKIASQSSPKKEPATASGSKVVLAEIAEADSSFTLVEVATNSEDVLKKRGDHRAIASLSPVSTYNLRDTGDSKGARKLSVMDTKDESIESKMEIVREKDISHGGTAYSIDSMTSELEVSSVTASNRRRSVRGRTSPEIPLMCAVGANVPKAPGRNDDIDLAFLPDLSVFVNQTNADNQSGRAATSTVRYRTRSRSHSQSTSEMDTYAPYSPLPKEAPHRRQANANSEVQSSPKRKLTEERLSSPNSVPAVPVVNHSEMSVEKFSPDKPFLQIKTSTLCRLDKFQPTRYSKTSSPTSPVSPLGSSQSLERDSSANLSSTNVHQAGAELQKSAVGTISLIPVRTRSEKSAVNSTNKRQLASGSKAEQTSACDTTTVRRSTRLSTKVDPNTTLSQSSSASPAKTRVAASRKSLPSPAK